MKNNDLNQCNKNITLVLLVSFSFLIPVVMKVVFLFTSLCFSFCYCKQNMSDLHNSCIITLVQELNEAQHNEFISTVTNPPFNGKVKREFPLIGAYEIQFSSNEPIEQLKKLPNVLKVDMNTEFHILDYPDL